jgi:hypothetical protein
MVSQSYHLRGVQIYIPRSTSCLDDCAIGKNHGQVDDPVLHSAISYGVGSTIAHQSWPTYP